MATEDCKLWGPGCGHKGLMIMEGGSVGPQGAYNFGRGHVVAEGEPVGPQGLEVVIVDPVTIHRGPRLLNMGTRL